MTASDIDQILAEFRTWLEANDEPPAERIDTGAIVAQFTALRHEVNLQTKASRAIAERAEKAAEDIHPAVKLLLELGDVIGQSASKLRKVPDAVDPLFQQITNEVLPSPPPDTRPLGGLLGRLMGIDYRASQERWKSWADEVELFDTKRYETVEDTKGDILGILESAADGYAMSLRRIEAALPAMGVTPIPVLGQTFDPHTMEVVDTGGDGPSGTVTEELRRGYMCNGKILRYAQVRVAA